MKAGEIGDALEIVEYSRGMAGEVDQGKTECEEVVRVDVVAGTPFQTLWRGLSADSYLSL